MGASLTNEYQHNIIPASFYIFQKIYQYKNVNILIFQKYCDTNTIILKTQQFTNHSIH